VRVALLARAGQAREQLHRALDEAGAEIVAEGDPGELDPKDVAEKLPKVFLVSLDPSTEKSIDRFDALFVAEGVEVMFDDAEVTSKLDGWDLNRWARHLVCKLLGGESLPPAPAGAHAIGEGADEVADAGMVLRPGAPPTPAELMDGAKLEDYTSDSPELADWVPTSPSLTASAASDAAPADADAGFSWEGSDAGAGQGEEEEFKLDTDLGIDIDLASLDSAPTHEAPAPVAQARLEDEPIFKDMEMAEGLRFSSFSEDAASESSGDLDADVAALAAQLEAFEKSDTRGSAKDPEFARPETGEEAAIDSKATRVMPRVTPNVMPKVVAKSPEAAAPAKAERSGPSLDFSSLSLASMDDEIAPPPPVEVKFAAPGASVAKAPSGFGDLSLEGDEPAPSAVPAAVSAERGAVLILAGLGGPDAVRQLLSSLPDRLAVPVLLYQHLEVGKHERLVEQLAKISKLPVVLARDDTFPQAGKVTLLPAGMTAQGEPLRFASGALAQLITALPAADSMIVVLSGADPQLIPMILALKQQGALVLAQDPDICFDAAAADALRREGAAVYPALGLARQIGARWPL
jgi:chemotaxis response regulator CheB